MQPKTDVGIWEEVSARNRERLRGRHVEIRVLDEPTFKVTGRSWAEFEESVAAITHGLQLPAARFLTAEDFCKSAE